MIALVSTKTDCQSATNQKQAVVSRAKILVKYWLLMENLGALSLASTLKISLAPGYVFSPR